MPMSDASIAETKALFDLNVFSILSTTQAFLPLLLANPNGAVLANNTSGASVAAVPFLNPYSASKAALASMSESMRLELAPFGIKVVDMKTGRVYSNFHANISANNMTMKLPEDSIYGVARDTVEDVLAGKPFQTGGTDADVWARKVVGDLTRKNPPDVVWRGAGSFLTWMATLLPNWLLDSERKKITMMDVVERKLKEQGKYKKVQ